MKKNKFGIIWLIIIFGSFIINASVPPMSYFKYDLQSYINNPTYHVITFCSFAPLFLAFACGFFEIYNVKKLLRVFLLIQPVKLVYDLIFHYLFNSFDYYIPAINEIVLLVISVYFAALYVKDKNNFKSNVKNNFKVILKTALFGVLGIFVYNFFTPIANTVIMIATADYKGEELSYFCTVGFLFEFIIQLCWMTLVVARMLIKLKSTSDVFEFDGTKNAKYALFAISLALMAVFPMDILPTGKSVIQYVFMGYDG